MEPIATYAERRFEGRRTVALLADPVLMEGREYLGGDYETRVGLAQLEPQFDRLRWRSKSFWSGFWACSGGVALQRVSKGAVDGLGGLGVALIIAGFGLMVATARKVEWVIFKNRAGHQGLALALASRNRSDFDRFVEQVARQIRITRESESVRAP